MLLFLHKRLHAIIFTYLLISLVVTPVVNNLTFGWDKSFRTKWWVVTEKERLNCINFIILIISSKFVIFFFYLDTLQPRRSLNFSSETLMKNASQLTFLHYSMMMSMKMMFNSKPRLSNLKFCLSLHLSSY